MVSLAYFLAQELAFKFPDSFGLIAAIWPAAGIALASLLLSPRRLWPMLLGCLFTAGIAANLTTDRPATASVGFMIANICETAVAAWLITRWCGDKISFARTRDVLALVVAASLINAVTALLGAGAAQLAMGSRFWTFYRTWWIADGLGLLLVTPLIVLWAAAAWRTRAGIRWGQMIETAGGLALGGAVAGFAFSLEPMEAFIEVHPYMLSVFVIWAAIRFGPRGTVTLLCLLSLIAIFCTAAGLGSFPLGGTDSTMRLLAVQIFLGVMGLTGLLLAAAIAQQKETQFLLRAVVDGTSDAIFVKDRQGRYLLFNAAAARFVGKDAAAVIGHDDTFLFPPEEAKAVMQGDQGVMAADATRTYEEHVTDGEGKSVALLATKGSFHGEAGEVVGLFGIARDITEHRRAEAALRESGAKFRAVAELSPMAIYASSGSDQKAVYMNEAFYKIFGFSMEDVPTVMHWWIKAFPDEKYRQQVFDQWTDNIEQSDKNHTDVEVLECVCICKDGSEKNIAWAGKTIGDEFWAFGYDFTERRRAEEALRASERRYRDLFDQANDGLLLMMTDGKISEVNSAFVAMHGYTMEELKKQTIQDLDVLQDRTLEDHADIVRRLEAGEVVRFEVEHRHKDGHLIPLAVTASLVTLGGRPFYLASHLDTTERKRAAAEKAKLETQLRQAQKMDSVGRLAGGVAHDFNNMLGVIIGHTEFALEHVDPAQSLHADLKEVLKAARRSADLTRQLLAFARKQTIEPKVLDLNETVDGMFKMLKRLIGENLDLAWQPGDGLWPVKMDPSQVDQILANLCVNARDAVGSAGRIIIETGNASVDRGACAEHPGLVPGDYVRLTVNDNGCGMDKDTLDHLFEPFFTTKGVGAGTGLGLATVYGIVKQNHGFIDVFSEPEKGATFKIYLPRHQGRDSQPPKTVPAAPAARGSETILLVEDDLAILNLTARMIEQQGYTVLAANSPEAAILLARKQTGEIRLLVTDVVMPGMNGRDLAKTLQTLHPHLKCLFMSGYTADIIAHHGVVDENVCFIQKPFSIPELAAKIREALEQPSTSNRQRDIPSQREANR